MRGGNKRRGEITRDTKKPPNYHKTTKTKPIIITQLNYNKKKKQHKKNQQKNKQQNQKKKKKTSENGKNLC